MGLLWYLQGFWRADMRGDPSDNRDRIVSQTEIGLDDAEAS